MAIWDKVWAEYDARQVDVGLRGDRALLPPDIVEGGSRWRFRALLRLTGVLVAVMVLAGLWLALPWALAMRLSAAIERGDGGAMLRQMDGPAALASLRAGLAEEVEAGHGTGARRFLGGMADRMTEAWARPEGMSAWLGVRRMGSGEAAAVASLSSVRSVRATGLGLFRVEYGPAREVEGVAFEMAWRGDGFRVTRVRFLGAAPPRPMLAMR